MNATPDKLSELLKQWPDLQPRPAFAADVLRRIRLDRHEHAGRTETAGVWGWLWGRTGVARLAAGTALAIAMLGGAGLALISRPAPAAPSLDAHAFTLLRPGSVSGNYLAMTEGR